MRLVESIRDVKDLQRHYAHMSRTGDVAGMALLFTEDAVLERGSDRWTGRREISQWLRNEASTWRTGSPGSLHFEIIDQPLVNLSMDGTRAAGRWQGKRFLGDGHGTARIEAGLYENEYKLESDGWRIDVMRYSPLYGGEYATGWTNEGNAGLPMLPPHYTPDDAGTPVPVVTSISTFGPDDAHDLAARIDRLNSEDDVRNLQHVCGYYIDQRMWTDVEDLFDEGALMRIDDLEYEGRDGIRRALELMGPEGLEHGELNDRVVFDVVVDVQPDGDTALCHGIELGLLGDARRGIGSWEFSAFTNRFVRRNGIWRLREATISRMLHADYREGWGHVGVVSASRVAPPESPEFTRRTELARTAPPSSGRPAGDGMLRDLERRLARSRAYDGVENVSAAYGYYLDDFQWPQMAAIFAAKGHKQSPFAGYYLGPGRILEAATASRGAPKPEDAVRERLVIHWRPQNVIMVSHDGRSANLRTRLFQTRTATQVTPEWTGVHGGSYANDQAVLEDGVWRLWSVTIDEYSFASPSWSGGWASAQDRTTDPNPPASPLLQSCPPDIPLSEIGDRARGFRGGPGRTVVWPEIVPMWFHYRNPLSGRVPERYWPDCVPSVVAPETSMTRHGYQLPPSGPAVDGIERDAVEQLGGYRP